ncbi:MAG: NADH-quinone oxidoreductase subunit G [Actinobacteria bacterium]|nr:NADH-quinone oxidoreductase subunit G [Actinomycetota bacterium]
MSEDLVTLTIDGKEVTVPAGTLIIRAAEQLGIEIPRFCDHPMLDPVGACRQCYVQIEGQPKLFTSCTTTVAPAMVVRTQNTSDEAHTAQVANLEFLLLNHPLDCPICDRGGECPLQDQALAFGPGESRYREAKRVYEKPLHLSALVNLDRERCVLCARCTRFCDQISGDRFIELYARGASQQVAIAPGEDFRSPFSGNTVQICPVGALTATPYRFVARPFDLSTADSVCPHCSAGCNLKIDMRRGEVVRQLARDNLEVNDGWACDKGRFAFGFPDSPDRITTPLVRDHGLEPASFGEVFGRIAEWTEGKRVAFLSGGRLTDEESYALSKLARTVFATNDLDHRRHLEGGELELLWAAGLTGVTYERVERAKAIVLVGLDAEQEVPILHLRIRKAARRGAKVFVIHHRRTRLHDVATHILCRPDEVAGLLAELAAGTSAAPAGLAGAALREAGNDGVMLIGAGALDRPGAADASLAAASATGARITMVSRRANDHGALRAGVHPGLLPGGRPIAVPEDRAEVELVWGQIPNYRPGRNARQILEACARREIDVLFLVGVDPLRDFPDAALALRALRNVPRKVVQSLELGSLEPYADAFLPAAAFVEKDGHFTTWEGRSQRLKPLRPAPGIALPEWEIFASLALACGSDLGFETLEELQEELGGLVAARESVPDWPPSPAPPPMAQGLELFTYPLLVDEGRLSEGAARLKAALQEEAFVEVHPQDAAATGLAAGGRAILRTEAGQAELPVRVTEHIARGTVFVPFNQPGLAANTLLSGTFATAVTLEPAHAAAGPSGGPADAQPEEVPA